MWPGILPHTTKFWKTEDIHNWQPWSTACCRYCSQLQEGGDVGGFKRGLKSWPLSQAVEIKQMIRTVLKEQDPKKVTLPGYSTEAVQEAQFAAFLEAVFGQYKDLPGLHRISLVPYSLKAFNVPLKKPPPTREYAFENYRPHAQRDASIRVCIGSGNEEQARFNQRKKEEEDQNEKLFEKFLEKEHPAEYRKKIAEQQQPKRLYKTAVEHHVIAGQGKVMPQIVELGFVTKFPRTDYMYEKLGGAAFLVDIQKDFIQAVHARKFGEYPNCLNERDWKASLLYIKAAHGVDDKFIRFAWEAYKTFRKQYKPVRK
jgi:hypothetical protein